MSKLKTISLTEAVQYTVAGKQVYMIRLIDSTTPIGELNSAEGFVTRAEAEPEEVAGQTEAPAQKRKRGRPASVDKGKINSLYEAGWSAEAIAEEVGAPVAKVRALTMQEDL